MAYLDLIKRPLEIGDAVVMGRPRYSGLCIGTIVAFTPKKVRVKYINNWNYKAMEETILVEPFSLCKIDGPHYTEYLLKKSG